MFEYVVTFRYRYYGLTIRDDEVYYADTAEDAQDMAFEDYGGFPNFCFIGIEQTV